MEPSSHADSRPHSRSGSCRRWLATTIALVFTAMALAACGISDERNASFGRATPNQGEVGGGPNVEQLRALLPTAEEIGPGYRIQEVDLNQMHDPRAAAEVTQQLIAACPGMVEFADDLLNQGLPDYQNIAARNFISTSGAAIAVALDPTTAWTESSLEARIAAVNECKTVRFETQGVSMDMSLHITRDDGFGGIGAIYAYDMTMDVPGVPAPIVVRSVMRFVQVGPIQLAVVAAGGSNPANGSDVAPDTATADRVTAELAAKAAQLAQD